MSTTPRCDALIKRLIDGSIPVPSALATLAEQLELELAECRADLFEEQSFAPAAVGGTPIAWLHKDHATAYVITERVKNIWEEIDPEHVENYTVPLYMVQHVQTAFVTPIYEEAVAARSETATPDRLGTIARALYASEINCGIQSFWDGGWSAWLGDELNGRLAMEMNFDTFDEIADWLHEKALTRYPNSEYAKSATNRQGEAK